MRMLVDGTKLFFSVKKVFAGTRIDYERIAQLSSRDKYYFTTYNPANDKQESFLRILRGFGFQVETQVVTGDMVYDFDAKIAFLLAKFAQPCYVLSNSRYLLPLVRETGSTLCWFSSDLPAEILLSSYRDRNVNFMDLE